MRLGVVASQRYILLDGEVLGVKHSGSRYLYVPDPLGSVHHMLDSSQAKAASFDYWPYGEVASKEGAEDTYLQFVGSLGYHAIMTNQAYVRARWYRPDLGRWMTQDPVGPRRGDSNPYWYAVGS